MALIGKIKTLFLDESKTTPVFPRTKVKAISDDNGIGLDAILEEIRSTEVIAEDVQMANGLSLEQALSGCWISFTDEENNPTDEPYIHYAVDENGNPVFTGLAYVEDGEF